MKKISFLLTLIFSVLLIGCTSTKINLVKENFLSVERLQTKRFRILSIHVYQENDHMKISGYVKRDYFYRSYAPGHVDIIVLSPENIVLNKVATSYTPHNIRSKGSRTGHFTVRIPEIPPKGSIIQAIHHEGGIKPQCL